MMSKSFIIVDDEPVSDFEILARQILDSERNSQRRCELMHAVRATAARRQTSVVNNNGPIDLIFEVRNGHKSPQQLKIGYKNFFSALSRDFFCHKKIA